MRARERRDRAVWFPARVVDAVTAQEQNPMTTTRRTKPRTGWWVGCFAAAWVGCASTTGGSTAVAGPDAEPPDVATVDAEDGPADAPRGEAVVDAAEGSDAPPTACPPSPPRPGLCAHDGLACSYPNGCTYRCQGWPQFRSAWYSTSGCF